VVLKLNDLTSQKDEKYKSSMAGMWLFSLLFDIYEVREDWKEVGMKGIQISDKFIILPLCR
jgi:hypothetical protein